MKKTFLRDIADYPMTAVKIENEYLNNADVKMAEYLMDINLDRYVAGFREMAGIEHKAEPYGGWENSLIAGHSVGHYITAIAQAYAYTESLGTPDEKILERVNALIDALNEAQIKEDGVVQGQNVKKGYLFAATAKNWYDSEPLYGEQQFDNVEVGKGNIIEQAWVPWYTMHKILAGLIDAYKLTGNEKALETAEELGNWVYNRVGKYDSAKQQQVLNIEYGGMNDALYELYKITGNPKHATAAHMFDEISLFDELYNNNDVLAGKHANTTIPKVIGALKRYRTEQETELTSAMLKDSRNADYYLTVAENFWDMVVNDHSYVTGGNSENEHFRTAHTENASRNNVNCETCNTYNMLKLTRELYKITGECKYSDYYENTFLNAIVSSQNPETGMTMYFQPMASGYFKVYSDPYKNFWCCTGSGMESMTKLNDSIYYKKDNTIIVNQYISSVLTDIDNKVDLTQNSTLPNEEISTFTIKATETDATVNLALRIPDWVASLPIIKVNGEEISYIKSSGYTVIENLGDGDIVEIILPMKMVAYGLADSETAVAFKYGPTVLSAGLGEVIVSNNEELSESHGMGVRKPIGMENLNEYIVVDAEYGTREDWLNNIGENMVKTDGKLEFRLANTDRADLVFTPHYSKYKERYGIYWYLTDFADNDEAAILAAKEDGREKRVTIDSIEPGHDQQENGHGWKGENTIFAEGAGKILNYRLIKEGGYVDYQMVVNKSMKNYLEVTYVGTDAGKKMNIYIGDTKLAEVTAGDKNETVKYEIPHSLIEQYSYTADAGAVTIEGKDAVHVIFKADCGTDAPKLNGEVKIVTVI